MFSKTWWVILLATLLVSGMTGRLGFWQLGRAQTKEALNAMTESRQIEPALTNEDWAAAVLPDSWLQRRVAVEGRWLDQFTI
ncbi:MAG: SURF1 family protein, partial [Betaproteobacteria bacterium]|nr:SURF1 family protein [Betaproteobacteria bacterium]